ncbi:hypothetical protein [Marininema halotolerans]|uniref:Uncharacterized protein n=1 Tax=Marininema halotolerans TaxID=1155944 RepID=A0A1I6RG84_9BACL|nr:hypothetical protein [Marininema halotolerans]SFS63664.1 hypothetical protein SAMN05444972_10567 [Marininema halotolerans]
MKSFGKIAVTLVSILTVSSLTISPAYADGGEWVSAGADATFYENSKVVQITGGDFEASITVSGIRDANISEQDRYVNFELWEDDSTNEDDYVGSCEVELKSDLGFGHSDCIWRDIDKFVDGENGKAEFYLKRDSMLNYPASGVYYSGHDAEAPTDSQEMVVGDNYGEVVGYYIKDEKGFEKVQNPEQSGSVELGNGSPNHTVVEIDDPERAPACPGGWEYNASKTKYAFSKITYGKVGYNYGHKTMKFASTITTTKTQGTEFSSQVEVGGQIKAVAYEVGAKITSGGKISNSVTVSKSDTMEVYIDPGYKGWADYGSMRESWKGELYYLTDRCKKTKEKYLNVYLPRRDAYVFKDKKL